MMYGVGFGEIGGWGLLCLGADFLDLGFRFDLILCLKGC